MQLLMKNYIEVFGFPIYFYALTMVGGMLTGALIAWLLMKRRGLKSDIILDMMVVILPLAIIGARVYYVIFEWDSYNSFLEMINIRNGGLAIYGGVIGGALGVLIICLWKKINFLKLGDVLVPALILGQAIGRWGNFFNQEAHGELVTNPKYFGLPFSVEIDGAYYQATFFYESMWCLLGFILLFVFAWRYRGKADGLITMAYFVWYGLERLVVEGMRTDSL
ncbi:MAG: prolipoprotein diacylglyceryl transferase, partial [Clostridia bacterium]|nr:prolipoprotein diacylglyceryl transferase [Clostridia bacterium]